MGYTPVFSSISRRSWTAKLFLLTAVIMADMFASFCFIGGELNRRETLGPACWLDGCPEGLAAMLTSHAANPDSNICQTTDR